MKDHADDLRAVRLAAWFHDAVYDGRPGIDEERSAQLAQSRLTALTLAPTPGTAVTHSPVTPATAPHPAAGNDDAPFPPAAETPPTRATVLEVARLVRVTARHSYTEGDVNAAVLCDADLAVLGQDPATYDVYAAAIRQEYRHVPEPLFRMGRGEVLSRLLTGPLYGTETGRELWERQARENLARELRHITD
ncbi:hypothetical protein HerbRD11066_05680 [Herbidospora sp. RD11066]